MAEPIQYARSTGPVTPEGKQNSSRNAVSHGLTCRTLFFIGDETQEEFDAHAETWRRTHQDFASPALDSLLDTLIQADWLQKRAYRRVFESENALAFAELNREPPEYIHEIFRRLQTMLRHKTALENSFARALRAVEAWRKARLAEELTRVRIQRIRQTITRSDAASIRSAPRISHNQESPQNTIPKPAPDSDYVLSDPPGEETTAMSLGIPTSR